MYFTNPSKLSYDMALTNTWAVVFDDEKFNILKSVDDTPLFPASDVSFKELTMNNAPLQVGIGGALDLSTPSSVTLTTGVELSFIDDDKQSINDAIRAWIKNSPVFTNGRCLNLTKASQYTKTLTLHKLTKAGEPITGESKLIFTVFPSEELVQDFNSNISFRTDKLSLRCY